MQEIRLNATYKTNVKESAKQDEKAIRDVGNAFTETAAKGESYERATQSLKRSLTDSSSESRSFKTAIRDTNNEMKKTPATAAKSSSAFGNLGKSLLRIAKLRFLRGIIRSITQAFSEGLGNIYQYSTAIGNVDASHISGTMNEIASTFLYVKNSIGSVVAPLLTSLLPAIQTVAGWFVVAANAVAQFFAALGGQTTYTRAKKQATTWKDVGASVGGAAAAAEEYKNTILGFDEIHALNDPSSGGGGGGGGGGASPDFSDMFEEVPLATDGLLGAFNKLARLLKPILDTALDIISQFVEGGVGILDGFATFLDGYLTGSQEKMDKGVRAMQDVFANNEVWNWLAHAFDWLNAQIDLLWIDMKTGFLIAIRDILDKGSLAFKLLFGVDTTPLIEAIDQSISGLQDQAKQVEFNQQLWDGYWNGDYDYKTLVQMLKDVENGTIDVSRSVEDVIADYSILGSIGINTSSNVIKGIDLVMGNAKEMAKSVNGGKQSVDDLSKTKLDTSRISKPMGLLNSDAAKTSGSIRGVKSDTDALDRANPAFNGVRNGFGSLGSSADGASGKVWGVYNAVRSVDGMRASITLTANTVATAALDIGNRIRRSLGLAEGGFVPGFANGGFIPSYATGGSNIDSASLFMAHENGAPEMVGRIGNHTAVANTSQMVEAITRGVADGVSTVLGSGANGNVEVNVTLDGQRIARAVDNANRVRNRRFNVQA